MLFTLTCILLLTRITNAVSDERTVKTSEDNIGDTSAPRDFIEIINPPEVITGQSVKITVQYNCIKNKYVGIEVVADFNDQQFQKVFKKIWRCHGSGDVPTSKIKKVTVKLQPEVGFNYNAFNPVVYLTSKEKLRAWLLDEEWWPSCFRSNNCFTRSAVRQSYPVQLTPPFSRPYFKFYRRCKSWAFDVITIVTSYRIPTCPIEEEIIEAIRYPVVCGGDQYGVYRQFKPYKNEELEANRIAQLYKPKFTVSIWLYVINHCQISSTRGNLCSIIQHTSWDGDFKTFLILFNNKGMIHIQVQHSNGDHSAGLTELKVPKHQWVRLVVQFTVSMWTVTIKYGKNFMETESTTHTHDGDRVYYNDVEDLFIFGGSEYMSTFKGYIGQATIYRNKVVDVKKITMPSQFHPMFQLEIVRREEKCSSLMEWVNERILLHKRKYQQHRQPETCPQPFLVLIRLIRGFLNKPKNTRNTCSINRRRPPRHRKLFDTLIADRVKNARYIDTMSIARDLYENVTETLETGINEIPAIFPILKQAACYGNTDAMYTLSVILNNGLYVKADEIQSQAYLMMAALYNHRLSALALGHKHRYGIEGVPLDWEASYRYHKFVADTTNADKQRHKNSDVYTESIRLTDEAALSQQTDEDGDLYHWLTYQAKQGVLSAQTHVARTLFWGQQGLKRNIETAVEYFKKSAETGDPQSQYDYGVILLRGQGVKKDMDSGLKQLKQSAEQKNPSAINAIGWHALNFEKDKVKAVEHFEKAFKLGSPDAAYNLGVMYLHGFYPDKEKDADKALAYFKYAAVREQIDAGVGLAYLSIKGTGKESRDVYIAVEWARFIAEKNPVIGMLLRKAITAYRKGKHDVSLFYYMMAADTGHEVSSFNTAWLCEENKAGVTSFIEKDCIWNRYNISIQREKQFQDPYALIKMGDYHWYGCEGHKDIKRAASLYASAARKNDPHALFNIGFMIEEGVEISSDILDTIRIPHQYRNNNVTLLQHLYTRCKESYKTEAYIPCSIALYRIQALYFWENYRTIIQLTGYSGVLAMTVLSTYVFIRSHLRARNLDVTNEI